MSAMFPKLWPGINPAKCFQAHPAPQVDITAINFTAEERDFTKLIPLLAGKIYQVMQTQPQAPGAPALFSKSQIETELRRHTGECSQRDLLIQYFKISYARITGKLDHGFELTPITPSETLLICERIHEGLGPCSAGMFNRMTDIVNGISRPTHFDQFTYLLIQNITEKTVFKNIPTAAGVLIDTHHRARFLKLASKYGLLSSHDPHITGDHTDEQILDFLDTQFSCDFHFSTLLQHHAEQIKIRLIEQGYSGGKTIQAAYIGDFLGNTLDFLNTYFGIQPNPDHLIPPPEWLEETDDPDPECISTYVTDINWPLVYQSIIKKLIDEHYLVLSISDLEALKNAEIYSGSSLGLEHQVSLFTKGTITQQIDFLSILSRFPKADFLIERIILQLETDPSQNLLFQAFRDKPSTALSLLKIIESDLSSETKAGLIAQVKLKDWKSLILQSVKNQPADLPFLFNITRTTLVPELYKNLLIEIFHAKDSEGVSTLINAAWKNPSAVPFLIEAILHIALETETQGLIQTLLTEKAPDGWTALRCAIRYQPTAVQPLLQLLDALNPGAEKDALIRTLLTEKNSDGWTVLMIAARSQPTTVLPLLQIINLLVNPWPEANTLIKEIWPKLSAEYQASLQEVLTHPLFLKNIEGPKSLSLTLRYIHNKTLFFRNKILAAMNLESDPANTQISFADLLTRQNSLSAANLISLVECKDQIREEVLLMSHEDQRKVFTAALNPENQSLAHDIFWTARSTWFFGKWKEYSLKKGNLGKLQKAFEALPTISTPVMNVLSMETDAAPAGLAALPPAY